MSGLDTYTISCPHCAAQIEVVIDNSAGEQEYIEDCSVCCRPIIINVHAGMKNEIIIDARRENE